LQGEQFGDGSAPASWWPRSSGTRANCILASGSS
jgi:hypothetical protein